MAPIKQITIIQGFMYIHEMTVFLQTDLTNIADTLIIDAKGIWKVGNLNIKVALLYSRLNGITLVSATPDSRTSVKSFIKSIIGLSLPMNPNVKFAIKFKGNMTSDGSVTLSLASDKGLNKFYAIYQKLGATASSAKGLVAEIQHLTLSSAIKKVINIDIASVPFFGTFKVNNLDLTYATDPITDLNQGDLSKSHLLQKLGYKINKGLTAFVKVPFHYQPLTLTYNNHTLMLTTPKKDLQLASILRYFGSNKLPLPSQLQGIFKVNIETMTIKNKRLTIDVSFPKRISFFSGFLSLFNTRVTVTVARRKPKISTKISGIINLAGIKFDTRLGPNKNGKYVLTAKTRNFNIKDLLKNLKISFLPQQIRSFLQNIPFLNFKLQNPVLSYTFGVKPMQMQLEGLPIIHGFKVTNMNSLIVNTRKRGSSMILGFQLGRLNLAGLLKKVTGFNFGKICPFLQQRLTSSVVVSPVSSRKLHFPSGSLESVPISKGVSITAAMTFPHSSHCRNDKFCVLAGRLIGHSTVLSIKATIASATYFPISASISNLNLGGNIKLASAGLEIVGGKSARVGLVGQVQLKNPPLLFSARISAGTKGLTLELSVANCWKKAFGVKWLTLCNFMGSIDFAPPTGITGVAFGAEIHLGYPNSGNQLKAKGYMGVSIINPLENYYYVKFTKITMGSLLKAFNIHFSLPKPLAQSGFPKGFLSSFSVTGQELPEVHLSIPAGFRLKGTLNILGLQGSADILIDLPKLVSIKVALPPIKVGSLLSMYASSTDTKRGPYLKAKVQVIPQQNVAIEAKGYLKVLGMSLEAGLKITNTQYEYFIRGKVLHLFEASMAITATFGNIKNASFRVKGEFKLDLFNKITKIDKNFFKNIANTARKAYEKAKKFVEKMVNLVKGAKRTFEWAKNKLKNLKRGKFFAQVMEKRSNLLARVMEKHSAKKYRKATSQGKTLNLDVKIVYLNLISHAGWGRSISRSFRRAARSVSRAARRAAERARKAAEKARRAVQRAARRAAEAARRKLLEAKRKLQEALKKVMKQFNDAKNTLNRFKNKLNVAKDLLKRVLNKFKVGLKIFDYLKKLGSGGIMSIRKLYFDVSLGTASGGSFAGGIDIRFMGQYNVKAGVNFNLHQITKFAKKIFQLLMQKLKKVFG